MLAIARFRPLVRSSFLALALALTACAELPNELIGEGGGGTGGDASGPSSSQATSTATSSSGSTSTGQGGEAGQTADFELSVSASETTIELRDSADVDVTITPNGYVGPVVLGVTGLPADVDATLGSGTVELDGSTEVTLTLELSSASDTTSGSFDFAVNAAAPEGTKSVSASLVVLPEITIYIPADLASFSGQNTAFGPFPTMIKALPNMSAANPITVKFFNQDSVSHEIHAEQAALGFPHGNQPIPPNSFDPVVREVNSAGTFNFYPHDLANGTTIPGRIIIE